jgi:hypothetical protein
VTKTARKYKATIATTAGPRKCLQASLERGEGQEPPVARFGGIPLTRQKTAVPIDRRPDRVIGPRKELVSRLLADRCEICERTGQVETHHVSKLADLERSGQSRPEWARIMARKRRKSLVVCPNCHDHIHDRQPAKTA